MRATRFQMRKGASRALINAIKISSFLLGMTKRNNGCSSRATSATEHTGGGVAPALPMLMYLSTLRVGSRRAFPPARSVALEARERGLGASCASGLVVAEELTGVLEDVAEIAVFEGVFNLVLDVVEVETAIEASEIEAATNIC